MKKRILAYTKQKEFYLLLLIGFVTVFSMTTLFFTNGSQKNLEEKNLVDLNEKVDEDLALEVPAEEAVETVGNNQQEAIDKLTEGTIVDKVADSDEAKVLAENEVPVGEAVETTNPVDTSEKKEEVPDSENKAPETKENKNESKKEAKLNFQKSDGLAWPVTGNVILPYSMDGSIYFETLDHYKYNPAMGIQGMIGGEVISAATGVVDKIEVHDETGLTVTINHGNNISTVYGQLKDLLVKEGDFVQKEELIGYLNAPTIYYTYEGSHLYFQLLEKGQAINPMDILD